VREAGKRSSRKAGKDVGAHGGAPLAHPDAGGTNPLQAAPIEFVGSFPDPLVKLEPHLPEIAFIGRSNVGKSSLLNALVGRPGLARVSGTPGKTTLLNFYRLPQLYLVDLPGYGFARAGKRERAGYRELMTRYLRSRDALAGIVWLLDIRHDLSREDREMRELLVESQRPVLATFTKADKLTRSALRAHQRDLAAAVELEPDQIQVTSSRSGLGVAELANSILAVAERKGT
jgi:GTP-binding protein